MPARRPRSQVAHLDRPLRALAREEPEAILALLRLAAPGLVPVRARVTPEDVDDPSVELGPAGGMADFVARVGRMLLIHVEFQGYRDQLFGRRLVFYNAGLLKRYPRLRVKSVAIWTIRPPPTESRNEIRVHSVTLEVTSIVLPDLSAEVLMRDVKTACFAVGADPGGLSIDVVCRRAVEVMVQGQASEAAWMVARVVATAAGRYRELWDAMEQARVKPPLKHDLVRYGIDVGYRRGRRRGLQRGLEQGRTQGLEQGRAEGRQQGRAQGVALGLQRALLTTYAARFGQAPPAVVSAVEAMRDPEALLAWQTAFSTKSATAVCAMVLSGTRRGRG